MVGDVDRNLGHVRLLKVPSYRLDMLQSPRLKFINKKNNQIKVDLKNFIIKPCIRNQNHNTPDSKKN